MTEAAGGLDWGGSAFDVTNYRPPGPVAAAFLQADVAAEPVRFLLGPIGSGKTTVCIFDTIRRATLSAPICTDGVARMRMGVIRDTYRNLYNTTIRSWWNWFPKSVGEWRGGDDRPAEHFVRMRTIRGGRELVVELHMRFVALGADTVENVTRGWELTAAWLNEADLLPKDAMSHLSGRIGRYPSTSMLLPGQSYPSYLIGDLNAPDTDSYVYADFVEQPRAGHRLYRQPSGLSPRAENTAHLTEGVGYYRRLVLGRDDWWVRRFVHAEFGFSRDGLPVYPEFRDQTHVAPAPLAAIKGVPIRIGLDAALHPAAVVSQWMPDGQWRVLAELVPGRIGQRRFAELLQTLLLQIAPGCDIASIHVDPTAFAGADREGGELSWAEAVQQVLRFPVEPAPSNELSLRLDAVRQPLRWQLDDAQPGLLLSPACKLLRKGFNSHYRFRRQRVGNHDQFADKPEKNDWSHPQDALQYLILGSMGRAAVVRGQMPARGERAAALGRGGRGAVVQARTPGDFDAFAVGRR